MIEQQNVDFVKEFGVRAVQHTTLSEKMNGLHDRAITIAFKRSNIITKLQSKCMGTGTSSLRRTTLEISDRRPYEYSDNGVERKTETVEYLTFNHKGIGEIRDFVAWTGPNPPSNYVYGSCVSSELRGDKFLKFFLSKQNRDATKNELIKMNANKLLRTFVDLENTVPEVETIASVSALIKNNNITKQLPEMMTVQVPTMDKNKGQLNLEIFHATAIKITSKTDVYLIGKWDTPKYETSYEGSTPVEEEVTEARLDTKEIECALTFIQMTSVLNQVFEEISIDLNKMETIIADNEEVIYSKLAVYLVMDELSDKKE